MTRTAALKRPEDEEPQTPATVARECLAKSDGNLIAATELMVRTVEKDSGLYRALHDPLTRAACYDAVSQQTRSARSAVWNAPLAQPSSIALRGRVIDLARGTINSLMNFQLPIPGGGWLRDAERPAVLASKEFYGKQSKDMGEKERWLQLIAQHLPNGKTVGQVMDEARLRELQAEAIKNGTTEQRRVRRAPKQRSA